LDNFELKNLNSIECDPTHVAYARYLEDHCFLPAHSDQSYWSHLEKNQVPVQNEDAAARVAAQLLESRGLFNIFPVALNSPLLDKIQPGKSLGTAEIVIGNDVFLFSYCGLHARH
jgi:hypothetical protein